MSERSGSDGGDDPIRGALAASRRDLLFGLATLVIVQRGLPLLFPLSPAHAQGVTAMSWMSATQRAVFDSVLYDHAREYLAYAKVVQDNLRGGEAIAAFDRALAETTAPGDLINAFNDTLARGIAIDLAFLPSPNQPPSTLSKILQPTIPRIGLPETLGRNIDGVVNQGAAPVASIQALIGNVQGIVPVVSKDVSEIYWRAGLTLLTARDDLTGLVAAATAALGTAGNDGRAIAERVSQITNAVSSIAASGSRQGFNYAAAAEGLTKAVAALGELLHMNRDTVDKVNKTVNVVGSMLAGAAAGAALGPVGAAVGAVAGLLAGLFGSRGGDGTGKALAQLSTQIAQLEQHVLMGLQQLAAAIGALSQQIVNLSQQIERDFEALGAQIAAFQAQMENRLDQIRELIVAQARTDMANKGFRMIENARDYDAHYRERRLGAGAAATAVADPLRDLRVLFDNMRHPPGGQFTGYCGPAFVGTPYSGYINDLSNRIAGRTPAAGMPGTPGASGQPRTLASWMRLADNFDVPSTPALLTQEVAMLAMRLRHNRYAIAESGDGNSPIDLRNGAGIVQGLQQQCFDLLGGIAVAPEYAFVSKSLLLPTGRTAPDPMAPQDIADVLANVQSAVSEISDSDKAAALANEAVAFLRPRLSAHYLLTGQNLLPTLLYIRRRALQELADSAAMVFCNPYMAAVQAFRRMVATKLSEASAFPVRANHSRLKIAKNVDAQGLIWNYRRAEQPLSAVAKVDFPTASSPPVVDAITQLSLAVESIFNGRLYLPGRTAPTSDPRDWTLYGTSYFGARLPAVISALSATAGPNTLTAHLTLIRDRCLLLGVIEQCIKARLAALAAMPGLAGSIPQLEDWFAGFQEYGMIAAFALAQPPVTTPGRPPESNMAEAVVAALLAPLNVGIPFPPPAPSEEAKVYTNNVGVFWGWGAEKFRPDMPTAPELIAVVLRPECAFAGENGAIMAALSTFSELQEALQIAKSKTALRNAVDRAGGIASLLRSSLQNA